MHDLHSMQSGLTRRLCCASSSRRGFLLYCDTGICSQATAALLVLLATVCVRQLATGMPCEAKCAHTLMGCFGLGVSPFHLAAEPHTVLPRTALPTQSRTDLLI